MYEGEGASNELIFDSVDSTGASARIRRCAKAGQLTGGRWVPARASDLAMHRSSSRVRCAWLMNAQCVRELNKKLVWRVKSEQQ